MAWSRPSHQLTESFDFGFGVEVMHRGPRQVVETTPRKIQLCGKDTARGEVDVLLAETFYEVRSGFTVLAEGHDGAFSLALVVNGHSWNSGQFRPQPCSEVRIPLFDGVHANFKGVVHRTGQSNPARHIAFPILKAFGSGTVLKLVGSGPSRRVEINEGRIELTEDFVGGVQKSGAPWSSQELAARSGEQVTADFPDIHRKLSDGLAGIE